VEATDDILADFNQAFEKIQHLIEKHDAQEAAKEHADLSE
jgi:hypothetical protein